ncbi:MAG: hypothetical protein OXN90_08590 [Gemmatimonadota bacterium]|nr:hypothetical protein [Gemmatimonadota bacterium]
MEPVVQDIVQPLGRYAFVDREGRAMAITRDEIVEGILEGAAAANAKYERWSNGWWVTDSGVEGLMTASIAEALHERQEEDERILMELSIAEVRRRSRARPRRGPRPETLGDAKRVDIVLLNRHNRAVCAIEVKRSWNRDACLKDLKRVHDLVRTLSFGDGGRLRRGFLALSIAKSATRRKLPEDRIAEEKRRIEETVRHWFRRKKTTGLRFDLGEPVPLAVQYQEIYGDWAAAGLCVEVYARS